jgi:photosystem II stability/assembly factor-like uncharacterized protein
MVSSTDGWAVGGAGALSQSVSTILRWDGTAWQPYPSPTQSKLLAVAMASATEGWAVGNEGTILRWDGTSWTAVDSPTNQALVTVAITPSGQAWAGGPMGALVHWDGIAWSRVQSPVAGTLWLRAIAMASDTLGWAVGSVDRQFGANVRAISITLEWNGSTWTEIHDPMDDDDFMNAISIVLPRDVWFVGQGDHIFYKGERWEGLGAPWRVTLNGLSMLSNTDGWAVGNEGVIAHFNGHLLSRVPSPTSLNLNSIAIVSPADGWAVGEQGVILRWDGQAWRDAN